MIGFLGGLGTGEIVLILAIALLLFGAKRLPELARSLGKSMKEFKKATRDLTEDIKDEDDSKSENDSKPDA